MQRRTLLCAALAAPLIVAGCATSAPSMSADAASSLAPTGRLRIAINYGNAVLEQGDAEGKLSGVSVDISTELAGRTRLPYTLVPFDAAGKVSAAVASDAWDIAFLALDPERAREIAFTAPYVLINGTYV